MASGQEVLIGDGYGNLSRKELMDWDCALHYTTKWATPEELEEARQQVIWARHGQHYLDTYLSSK